MPEKPKPQPSPLQPDVALEAEAQKMGANPMHPLVAKITQRLGAFNLIRNARNEKTVEIEQISKQM